MSMMPAVRRPYSAGRAPVISSIFGEARAERLAEHAQSFGQDNAVEAELQAVVLATDVQLAKAVLHHPGACSTTWFRGAFSPPGRAWIAWASRV